MDVYAGKEFGWVRDVPAHLVQAAPRPDPADYKGCEWQSAACEAEMKRRAIAAEFAKARLVAMIGGAEVAP